MDTSAELLEDDTIRTALAQYLVDQLYQSADVQQRLEEILPPRLDRLAAPASAGLRELARRNAPRILGTAVALNAWKESNREAHRTLLAIVRGDAADGGLSLDLGQLLGQIADRTGLPPGAVDRLPPEVASLQIARPGELDTAKQVLDLLEEVPWILFVLALAAFAGAIYLGSDRRHGVLVVGATLIGAGVALLAVRRIAGNQLVDSLADAPNAGAAAGRAWDIGTSLLVEVAQGSMLLGLFIVTGSWLAGPARRAVAMRDWSVPALREHAGRVRAGLAFLLLLLVIWGPVPWTTKVVPLVLFAAAAFLWLEWIRGRALRGV